VFFWQIDSKFVQHFTRVARQAAKQCTVAVHHDETELAVIGEERRQCLHADTSMSVNVSTDKTHIDSCMTLLLFGCVAQW